MCGRASHVVHFPLLSVMCVLLRVPRATSVAYIYTALFPTAVVRSRAAFVRVFTLMPTVLWYRKQARGHGVFFAASYYIFRSPTEQQRRSKRQEEEEERHEEREANEIPVQQTVKYITA